MKTLFNLNETQPNQPGVAVWGALSSGCVRGPVFFYGSVDGEKYLQMLCEVVEPQLNTKPNFHELFFQ